jgi:alkanesulfonate monooxygenase SsuD/methylene tetrahydromethanopterin reductase-like flavin-dependent oxidoreductase (luciferase family)
MYTLRFDMRAPAAGASTVDLYAAALEMTSWAESRGAVSAMVCEHHMASDGYLPAPMTLASALAARTSQIPIMVAIFQLPLYNSVRLAEEMCVLDIISRGRVSYVGGLGYRPEEYEMLGVDYSARGKLADENLELLLKAVRGEPFEHNGRQIHVTPGPITSGGPSIAWGGGSPPAARRAGRLGLNFFAQTDNPELGEIYNKACHDNGHKPGMCALPSPESPSTVFVSDDLDAAWDELGPYLMNDVLGYAEWNEGNTDTASLSFVRTADELRRENRSHRILTLDEAVAFIRAGGPLPLHPLIGGLPPKIAWKYLKHVAEEVLPQVVG